MQITCINDKTNRCISKCYNKTIVYINDEANKCISRCYDKAIE